MKKLKELPLCPVATTISLIGTKWKLLIIRNLMERPWRFNELKRSLEGISQKMLTESLRELEEDGIVSRIDYKTNPPKVEYLLTETGKMLNQTLLSLQEFGYYYKSKYSDDN